GVVGAPAENQLGEVTGADHEAMVEEDLGADARLRVLENEILASFGELQQKPSESLHQPVLEGGEGQVVFAAAQVGGEGAELLLVELLQVDAERIVLAV